MSNKLRTKWYQFINVPPKNPTQTFIARFKRTPQGEFNTLFEKSEKNFLQHMNSTLRTKYSDILENKDGY